MIFIMHSFSARFRSLFCAQYLGRIVKCLLNFAALSYITYLNSSQLQTFIESAAAASAVAASAAIALDERAITVNGPPVVTPMMVLYVMGTGVVNFTYFEWSINAANKIAAVLEHWWTRPLFAAAIADGNGGNIDSDMMDDYNGAQWDFLASEESNWTFM